MPRCVICHSRFYAHPNNGPEPCNCGANLRPAEAWELDPREIRAARERWAQAEAANRNGDVREDTHP